MQQEACEEHSFSPICYKCRHVQAMAGSKSNWQQVTDLISFRKLKDDTYKICAKYKFESPPETKFCISNKIEAFQYSHSEYKSKIGQMENGRQLLQNQLIKNIKDGGFEVLTREETAKVLKNLTILLKII